MSATSRRAEKIFNYLIKQDKPELFIRQATLAEKYNCSCRSIGRALKQLKEEGLLVDLNQRHKNRCKMYRVELRHVSEKTTPHPISTSRNLPLPQGERAEQLLRNNALPQEKKVEYLTLTPEAETQWERYQKTFSLVFKTSDLKIYYAQVTQELRGVTDELELYKKTFAGLWELEA